MDPDMNKYDVEHVCTGHPLMSDEAWNKTYRDAWKRYYTDEHVETVLQARRRHGLEDEQDRRRDDGLLLRRADRGRSPAAMRHRPPQGEDDPPARDADRQSADFLSRPGGRVRVRGRAMADRRVALSQDQEARRRRIPPARPMSTTRRGRSRSRTMENDELVMAFADKIPDTYGAPKRQPVAAA